MRREARRSRTIIGLTLIATPIALGTEQLLARYVMPPDLAIVRDHFADTLIPVGWALIAATMSAGLFSHIAFRRSMRRAAAPRAPASDRDRKRLGSFLFYASLPQVPAVVTTVATLLGVQVIHAVLAVAISTVAIAVMGWTAWPTGPGDGSV